ncbi:MAG TPA: NHL repeat-containing protein [Gemmatimonadales bacterium]|nr:NHL repeat-containing protein [Gemmatimonadales bacterium]
MRRTGLEATVILLLPFALGCMADSTIPELPAQAGLWTASAAPSAILRLDPRQLADTGGRDPATIVTTASARLERLLAVAFDDQGTLWVASQSDSTILSFPSGALAGGGSQTAARVITPVRGSLSGPTGLAFDARGRLWVVDNGTGTLNRYDAAQLAAGGAQEPAVTIRMPGSPSAIAFDAAGALWVADHQFNLIVKFPAESLATSGSKPPVFYLQDSAHTLMNPAGIAFDAAGNLWVANLSARTIVSFTPTQLAVGGAQLPHVVLSSNAGSLHNPLGVAFDAVGNLWVVNADGGVTGFARASLDASGTPAPITQVQISGHSLFWSLAFWPKPAGLPLN